jgi:hypothetical protein
MTIGKIAVLVVTLALVLIGCDLSPPTSENGWSTVTVSLYGTAYSDVEITVQTDVEGVHPYTVTVAIPPASISWEYYQFSFEEDYSIQVSAPDFPSTSGTTSVDSTSVSAGGHTVYKITDSSASFQTDAASLDVIRNDDPAAAGVSVRVFSVIDDHTIYINGDINGQNIFDPASYPAPVPYTIYKSHALLLCTIVTDSSNSQTETTYRQTNYIIDLQVNN